MNKLLMILLILHLTLIGLSVVVLFIAPQRQNKVLPYMTLISRGVIRMMSLILAALIVITMNGEGISRTLIEAFTKSFF